MFKGWHAGEIAGCIILLLGGTFAVVMLAGLVLLFLFFGGNI